MAVRPSLLPLRRFGSDTAGVSAVEFAVILPFMLLLLLGSFDITRMLDVQSKLSLLSRTTSDLVSQEKDGVSVTELATIVQAAKSILYPYPDGSSVLAIRIESIRKVDDTYEIDWSYETDRATKEKSENESTQYLPTEDSVIRSKVTYVYNLEFAGFLLSRIGFDKITLNSSTSMSPRLGTPVEPTDF